MSSDRPLLYFPDGENEGSAQGRLEKGASLYQRAAKEEETAEEVGRSREVSGVLTHERAGLNS